MSNIDSSLSECYSQLSAMLLNLAVLLLYTAPCLCGVDPKIVNGWTVSQGQIPYQVSLRNSGWTLDHYCGGSVIDKSHILTAAHCVDERDPEDIQIIVGDVKLDRSSCTSARRYVEAIFIHEDFGVNLANDIAVIRLSKELPTDNPNIKAIQLMNDTVPVGTSCTVSGWGVTSEGTYDLPSELQAAYVTITDTEECKQRYDRLSPGMICAGTGGGQDSCQGDSGGPLQCAGKLVGVVSWGKGCGDPQFPGVYTEVSYFRDWILNKTLS